MRLSYLLKEIISLPEDADCEVIHLELDSRKVTKNSLFFALKGHQQDGRHYIPNAIAQGASAILLEDDEKTAITYQANIPLISIPRLKNQLGNIAARFYDFPAKKLRMIGVTGTNGKTSCTHFIAQALGEPCGIIGTLGSGLYGHLGEPGLTTPDAVSLQRLLHQFVKQSAKAVAMEVSSHSIDQGRVNGIDYEIGVFTNLTQDHLDYHKSMEAYAAVKRRFLADMPTEHVIINADDAYGKQWIGELAQHKSVFAYSIEKPVFQSANQKVPLIYTEEVEFTLEGMKAKLYTPWGNGILQTPLIGRFNLSNVLAVVTALCFYGIPLEQVLARLTKLKPVPGRMQTLGGQGKPIAVVDYAHTPDALEKVLQSLRPHTEGKLICVFGCGGDRDPGKRPQMAKIAEALADQVIVTNDNPRHESPEAIAKQIMQGFRHPERILVQLDRSHAIEKSIQLATGKDCVLIAGKGAERYQQIGDDKLPFDDVEKVVECLERV